MVADNHARKLQATVAAGSEYLWIIPHRRTPSRELDLPDRQWIHSMWIQMRAHTVGRRWRAAVMMQSWNEIVFLASVYGLTRTKKSMCLIRGGMPQQCIHVWIIYVGKEFNKKLICDIWIQIKLIWLDFVKLCSCSAVCLYILVCKVSSLRET